jgi:hypothetical protein
MMGPEELLHVGPLGQANKQAERVGGLTRVVALQLAPRSISSFTSSVWPWWAASIRGVSMSCRG